MLMFCDGNHHGVGTYFWVMVCDGTRHGQRAKQGHRFSHSLAGLQSTLADSLSEAPDDGRGGKFSTRPSPEASETSCVGIYKQGQSKDVAFTRGSRGESIEQEFEEYKGGGAACCKAVGAAAS